MLRYLNAGESHGKGIVAILEGMPAGLRVEVGSLNQELKRRQQGFGRGKRMQIEKDRAQIISGLKKGITLGSPIALLIQNKDVSIEKLKKVLCPRPGHADLAGLLKYGFSDIANVPVDNERSLYGRQSAYFKLPMYGKYDRPDIPWYNLYLLFWQPRQFFIKR